MGPILFFFFFFLEFLFPDARPELSIEAPQHRGAACRLESEWRCAIDRPQPSGGPFHIIRLMGVSLGSLSPWGAQAPESPHPPRLEAEVGEMRENSPEQPPPRGLVTDPLVRISD